MSKRGGNRGRVRGWNKEAARAAQALMDRGSMTGTIEGEAIHYLGTPAGTESDEINEHGLLIPGRKSLSVRQRLGSFSQDLEFSNLNDFSVSLLTGKREETKTVGNPRKLEWKSDRTLLRRGNPFALTVQNSGELKRQTSKSKRIVPFREIEIVQPEDIPSNSKMGNSATPADVDDLEI